MCVMLVKKCVFDLKMCKKLVWCQKKGKFNRLLLLDCWVYQSVWSSDQNIKVDSKVKNADKTCFRTPTAEKRHSHTYFQRKHWSLNSTHKKNQSIHSGKFFVYNSGHVPPNIYNRNTCDLFSVFENAHTPNE